MTQRTTDIEHTAETAVNDRGTGAVSDRVRGTPGRDPAAARGRAAAEAQAGWPPSDADMKEVFAAHRALERSLPELDLCIARLLMDHRVLRDPEEIARRLTHELRRDITGQQVREGTARIRATLAAIRGRRGAPGAARRSADLEREAEDLGAGADGDAHRTLRLGPRGRHE